jgi:hypothetical protein
LVSGRRLCQHRAQRRSAAGLVAAINFAGGRGSRDEDDVCDEDCWCAFAALGKTSRIPTLWIYAENDKFLARLAHRMHAAFTRAGGRAQFIDAAAFGEDGHSLFSRAFRYGPLWSTIFCARRSGTA